MNIVMNAVLAHENPRGVGRYINNLLPSLAEIDHENQYYIYYGTWMKDYMFLKVNQANFHFLPLDIKNHQLTRNLYLALALPYICRKYDPDIFFLIDTQAILIKPCPILSTIHDLAEYEAPEKYSKLQACLRKVIVRHQIHISDKIITVSDYSRQSIYNRFKPEKGKVKVIYNSVECKPNTLPQCQPENYFLFVGETERAKNFGVLLDAFKMLPANIQEKYHVIVVGKKGNDHENILGKIRGTHLESKVHFKGYVPDNELMELYAKAYAFVFPSLFEGFGLPVLEAMAYGVPVLCSNTSSIPEVGGEAVLTFNPHSPSELCAQALKLINTPRLRESMIQKGLERARLFTKEKAAQETIHSFHEIFGAHKKSLN